MGEANTHEVRLQKVDDLIKFKEGLETKVQVKEREASELENGMDRLKAEMQVWHFLSMHFLCIFTFINDSHLPLRD